MGEDEPMAGTPPHPSTSGYPPAYPPAQLSVHFEVLEERMGGCRVTFSAPEGSALVAKYGGKGRALAACRDIIVGDLDFLIKEFFDEE